MVERLIPILAAIIAPLAGVALQASRRTRLRHRTSELLRLADEIQAHDEAAATALRRVAGETAQELARRDQKWLRRKVEPVLVLSVAFLCSPGIAAIYFSIQWEHGLDWLAAVVGGLWVLAWIAGGVAQVSSAAAESTS
jgi:hypothetical protein